MLLSRLGFLPAIALALVIASSSVLADGPVQSTLAVSSPALASPAAAKPPASVNALTLISWPQMLAMVAVGLWAQQLRGRAKTLLPITFLGAILLGGIMAGAEMTLRASEVAVWVSALVLGGLVAFAIKLPLGAALSIVGVFGVFHGYAQISETPAGLSAWGHATALLFIAGILMSTGLLVASAITKVVHSPAALRFVGGAVSAGAIVVAIAHL